MRSSEMCIRDSVYTVEEIGKTAGYISTVTGNATEGFIITNTITSVKISKVDITDQKELAGAHIQIDVYKRQR